MQIVLRNFRHMLRGLTRSPGFSVSAILILALAIGANTAIFSLVQAILLHQLPFHEPNRIMTVRNDPFAGLGSEGSQQFYDGYRSMHSVESAAIYASFGANFRAKGTVERLTGTEVSAQFLDVLGVRTVLGRRFLPGEDASDKDNVVLLSYALWKRDFHGDKDVLGQSIVVNGMPFAVVGILPSQVTFPSHTDFWLPTAFDEHRTIKGGGAVFLQSIVRLRSGISSLEAENEYRARIRQMDHGMDRSVSPEREPSVSPLGEDLTRQIRPALLMLAAAVGLVLLLACANLAGLMLVRASARSSEFSIRSALGATRIHLFTQQIGEAGVLSFCGGTLGLSGAYVGIHLLYLGRPDALANFPEPSMNFGVLAFAAGLATATAIVFSAIPAYLAVKQSSSMQSAAHIVNSSRRGRRLNQALIVFEIAVALVLSTGVGLLIRSMQKLSGVPLGYATHNILTFSVAPTGSEYVRQESGAINVEALRSFYDRSLEQLRRLPGVNRAALVSNVPMAKTDMLLPLVSPGSPGRVAFVAPRIVSDGYFAAMRIPILMGRDFSALDSASSDRVVVVTQDVARRLWGNDDPVGQRVSSPMFGKQVYTVAGVVPSTHHYGPRAKNSSEFYLPLSQSHWPAMTFVVRANRNPASLIAEIEKGQWLTDKQQPIFDVQTLRDRLDRSESLGHFEFLGLSIFTVLSVVLALSGLYGVIAYSVAQRKREIAVRMAFGSQRWQVLFMVLRQGLWLAITGVLFGIFASFLAVRVLRNVLFETSAHDPAVFAESCLMFLLFALFASAIPAFRAATLDPIRVLRRE